MGSLDVRRISTVRTLRIQAPSGRPVVKRMPDRRTLEAFLAGMNGPVRVIFDAERGQFEWVEKRE